MHPAWCDLIEFLKRQGPSGRGEGARPGPRPQDEPGLLEGERLLCSACGAPITGEEQAIDVRDSHEHTFVNPAGIIYAIRCFRSAPGCLEAGTFTTEYSWFPGYAWRYALCGSCVEHLGWSYRSETGQAFYGLIADRLVHGTIH